MTEDATETALLLVLRLWGGGFSGGPVLGALRASALLRGIRDHLYRHLVLGSLGAPALLGGLHDFVLGILGLVLGTLRATALLRGGNRSGLCLLLYLRRGIVLREDEGGDLLLEVIRGAVGGDDGQGKLLHKGGDLSGVREGGHIGVC